MIKRWNGGRGLESSRSELNRKSHRVSASHGNFLSRGAVSEYATYDLESRKTDEGMEQELINKQTMNPATQVLAVNSQRRIGWSLQVKRMNIVPRITVPENYGAGSFRCDGR